TYFWELMAGVFHLDPRHVPTIGCTTVVILTTANLVGAKLGSAIQSVFTAIKIGALLMLMVVSFFLVDGSLSHLGSRTDTEFNLGSLGVGVASVIWAYDGWVAVSMIAGEVIAAEKLMKRIIVAG